MVLGNIPGAPVVDDPLALLRDRRSRPALTAPAPDRDVLRHLLTAACSAPDHGRLRPWRFIVVDDAARGSLGDSFAAAHAERDPSADPAELDRTRAKALRAPMIVIVVGTTRPHPKVPEWEQRAAAACVAHGVVLGAHALGFGAMWRTGWFGEAPKVRAHLGLADGEEVTGWIYLGTPAGAAPAPRPATEPPVTWLG
ncbi:nitroreductase family protein [Pseudonocardia nigra]|uniref:nitroreductase family protein n=1 Tax=Pseudonocardia nigra TaxID=1921578 RepID=UPI001C5D021E|nr:nitroreductase [Pseudonocardia nigra]